MGEGSSRSKQREPRSRLADTCRDKEVSFTNGQETLNAGTVLRYLNSVQSSEPHQLCTLALVPLK